MKRLILVSYIFFFVATGMPERAYSDSVDVLYTNYSIQQSMNEVYDLYGPPTGTPVDIMGGPYIGRFSDSRSVQLSNNDGLPLSAETPFPHHLGGGSSSISLFSVQNSASAPPVGMLYPVPDGHISFIYGTEAIMDLNASWGFQPTSSSLEVNLLFSQSLWPYWTDNGNFLSAKLWDTTNSTVLISLDSGPTNNASYSNNYTFSVDPNHVYEFDVSATGHVWDKNTIQQDVTASIISVPEPATMLLLGFSLLSLLGPTKRFAKQSSQKC